MTSYVFGPGNYNETQLVQELATANLTPDHYSGSGYTGPGSFAGTVELFYQVPLSSAQVTAMGAALTAHVATRTLAQKLEGSPLPLRVVTALAILQATASTAAEKTKAQNIVDNAYTSIKALLI